jgi:hypothetical protein
LSYYDPFSAAIVSDYSTFAAPASSSVVNASQPADNRSTANSTSPSKAASTTSVLKPEIQKIETAPADEKLPSAAPPSLQLPD